MTQAILSGTAVGALYVLMAVGFALSLDIADIVNAAHGVLVVGGMYATLELVQEGVGVYLAVVLTGVGVGLFSWLIYVLFIRSARAEIGHRAMLVYTLLFLSALTVVYQLLFTADLRSLGRDFANIDVFSGYLTSAQLVAIVLAVVVPVGLYLVARYTMIGKLAYVASRYPLGARSIGTPVDRIYTVVFVLAGVLAGIAGGVLVTFQPVEPTLGLQYTVVVFLVALVARNNLLAVLGVGFAYGIVQSVLSYQIDASAGATLTLVLFLVALIAERVVNLGRGAYRRFNRPAPAPAAEGTR
jgi:branched-chain amino acid transport system permease protein